MPGLDRVWIRAVDGGLVRADSIAGLRCPDGEVIARWQDDWIRLAGPGCPPDFHFQLAAAITEAEEGFAMRSAVIVTADMTAGEPAWTCSTALRLTADAHPPLPATMTHPRPGQWQRRG